MFILVDVKVLVIVIVNLMMLCLMYDELVMEAVELSAAVTSVSETMLHDMSDVILLSIPHHELHAL